MKPSLFNYKNNSLKSINDYLFNPIFQYNFLDDQSTSKNAVCVVDDLVAFSKLETPPDSFFDVPKSVYADFSHHITENRQHIEAEFSAHNDFFNKGSISCGVIEGKTRLVGFIHPSYGEDVAYFGYWESINDLNINKRLFQAFENWTASKGVKHVYGPINFTTFEEYRVRLSHFDAAQYPREPHNPAYYIDLLTQLGYQKQHHYSSIYTKMEGALSKHTLSIHEKFKQGVDLQPLDRATWLGKLHGFYDLIQSSFMQNRRYTAISYPHFKESTGASFAQQLCPKSSFYSRDADGNITGMILIFPHYGQLCEQGSKHNITVGELDYDQHFSLLKQPQAIVKVIAVDPKFHNSRLYFLLCIEALKAVQQHYSHPLVEISILSETTKKLILKSKIHDEKHYGLFHKELG